MYYPLALLAVILTAVLPGHRLRPNASAAMTRLFSHPAVVPFAVLTLVLAQHAYLVLLLDATYHQHPMRDFMIRMPVRFISGLAPGTLGENYRSAFCALVLLESCALFALYRGLERVTRAKIAVVALGVVLACVDAVLSRAATSADMYAYVGFMLLGTHAYAPGPAGFAGEYALINIWWHTPLVSTPYGPLWLAVADVAGSLGHTLLAKIVLLRLLGVVALFGTVAALVAMKVPLRIVALVALNPALSFEFIANVHNDLFAVSLVLIARYATMRGAASVGIAFAVAAGLVKLPFLLFAALAFVPLPSRARRVSVYAITLVLALAVSWIAGGPPYLAALVRAANEGTAGHAISALIGVSALLKAIAVGAVAGALVTGVFIEGCAWTLPALSALLHPWYLSWTLPYAVASNDVLRNVAIALPVVMLISDGALGKGILVEVVAGLAYLWLAVSLAGTLKARLTARNLTA